MMESHTWVILLIKIEYQFSQAYLLNGTTGYIRFLLLPFLPITAFVQLMRLEGSGIDGPSIEKYIGLVKRVASCTKDAL